jgi:hypothetical protein
MRLPAGAVQPEDCSVVVAVNDEPRESISFAINEAEGVRVCGDEACPHGRCADDSPANQYVDGLWVTVEYPDRDGAVVCKSKPRSLAFGVE